MATEIITSFDQQCDANGAPMSGAKIYVYNVGTTTLRTIYNDDDLDVSHEASNPIVCDSAGRHDMRYTATGSYKIVVKTSADVTVYTRDNIDGRVPVGAGALAIANGGTGATSAAAALSNLGGATASELADVAADVAALSGTLASSEKTHIATGTTAQRPGTPVEGDIRRNTTNSDWEGYNGSGWDEFAIQTDTRFGYPTRQTLTSGTAATYTRPANVRRIVVRMIGGGGGGAGATANSGGTGGTTSFESWTAVGGSGGTSGGSGGAGGTGGATGTGTQYLRFTGAKGGSITTDSATIGRGGGGGPSPFGAGVVGLTQTNAAGTAGPTNSGSGGSGGSSGANAGPGGGAGEYVEFVITSPSSTYTYTVGAAGTAGAAGGNAGGAGGSGIIIVDEYY